MIKRVDRLGAVGVHAEELCYPWNLANLETRLVDDSQRKPRGHTKPRYIIESSPMWIMFLMSDPVFMKPISLLHVISLRRSHATDLSIHIFTQRETLDIGAYSTRSSRRGYMFCLHYRR